MSDDTARQRKEEKPANAVAESLGQFLAEILSELSISAWLPAATIVFIALLFWELRVSQGNVLESFRQISSIRAGGLALVIGAVILGTMLTQSVQEETLQVLAGSWGTSRPFNWLADIGCRYERWSRNQTEKKRAKLESQAQVVAQKELSRERETWSARGDRRIANIFAHDVLDVDDVDWTSRARPDDIRRLVAYSRKLSNEFPDEDSQVKPTRLGNVLRAHEIRAFGSIRDSLEGAVDRVFDTLPKHLQNSHDVALRRLRLNCTLFFIFGASAIASFPAIALGSIRSTPYEVAAAVCIIGLALALWSYGAAIAAAKRYGAVQQRIREVTPTPS